MKRTWLVVAILAPLVTAAGVAFAIYGVEGPPDNARVNGALRLIGMLYGAYVVGIVLYWRKGRGAHSA